MTHSQSGLEEKRRSLFSKPSALRVRLTLLTRHDGANDHNIRSVLNWRGSPLSNELLS